MSSNFWPAISLNAPTRTVANNGERWCTGTPYGCNYTVLYFQSGSLKSFNLGSEQERRQPFFFLNIENRRQQKCKYFDFTVPVMVFFQFFFHKLGFRSGSELAKLASRIQIKWFLIRNTAKHMHIYRELQLKSYKFNIHGCVGSVQYTYSTCKLYSHHLLKNS